MALIDDLNKINENFKEDFKLDDQTQLLCCPSCRFDKKTFEEHQKNIGIPVHLVDYWPIIYKSRFLNKWVIECQNCGLQLLFNETEKESCLELWNGLLRVI